MSKKLFVDNWIEKIQQSGIKQFPSHFIPSEELDIIFIPERTLIIGQEFFGTYEILTTDSELVYHAASLDEAKFFVYGSRGRNGKTYLPKDKSKTKSIVSFYNSYLDDILNQIQKDFKKSFPEEKNIHSTTSEIFQKLNLIRL